MPTTYAHFHFGRRAEPLLPEPVARAVRENRQLYDIGLHGPDILFYYQPLTSNPVGRLGGEMHDHPARDFFYPARDVYTSAENREGALAYLTGFLCHYALDSACHGYIEKKLTVSHLTHGEIEIELDRYLMEQDGKDPSRTVVTAHIVPSRENAAVIAPFFTDVDAGQIRRSLCLMKICCDLLSGRGWRRTAVNAGLRLTGQYERLHRMVMAERPLPESEDSDLRLGKLLNRGLERFARLVGPYLAFLQGGSFPDGLEQTFGPGDGWQEIPVLPVEEERGYEA